MFPNLFGELKYTLSIINGLKPVFPVLKTFLNSTTLPSRAMYLSVRDGRHSEAGAKHPALAFASLRWLCAKAHNSVGKKSVFNKKGVLNSPTVSSGVAWLRHCEAARPNSEFLLNIFFIKSYSNEPSYFDFSCGFFIKIANNFWTSL